MSVGKRRRDALQRKAALSAACPRTGKRRFRSLEAAQRVLDDAAWWRERGDEKRQERRAYECEACCGWHVSSLETWVDKPRTPIPARSKKTAKVYRDQRVPLVAEMLATRPLCEIRWDAGCTGRATQVDEKCGRGRGGDILDRDNLQTACNHCHQMKTANPAEARARGLEVSSAEYRARRDAS